MMNSKLRILVLILLVGLQAHNIQSYPVLTETSYSPNSIYQSQTLKQSNILKENCGQLCNDCNGVAFWDNNFCKCYVKTDYPMQCLERIQRKARTLGLNMRPKYPLRSKRCSGGELGEVGFPFQFGSLLGRSANGDESNGNEPVVGEPNEMFSNLAGILTAPLIEQIRAVVSGDSETAENSMGGQMVANLPKAVSSFTNLLDTFNLALPAPRPNTVGAGRSSDGSDDSDDSSDDNNRNGISNNPLRTLQTLNTMRSMFVGDSQGGVQNTLPVQFANSLPKAINTAVELFDSFTVGLPRRSGSSSAAGKSWLNEFDDDDEDDDKNKIPGGQPQKPKIIVSPIHSNREESGSILGSGNPDSIFSNVESILANGEPQIIQPQEAVIIITPVKPSQTLNSIGM